MPHILWLVYENPPHPDAVSYPAILDDVPSILEWLDAPRDKRIQLATQLHRLLKEQSTTPFRQRHSISCRCPSGIYRLIPWRLAQWLRHVLPKNDSVIARVRAPLGRWSQSVSSDVSHSASRSNEWSSNIPRS